MRTILRHVALVGNPNCGKTALFNLLTGSRQKVANYAGVTVERKEGRLHAPSGSTTRVLDLPGAYSLNAASLDEAVTATSFAASIPASRTGPAGLRGRRHQPAPAPALRAGAARAGQADMLVALNMMDAAKKRGIDIDVAALQRELGVPVVETVAVRRGGADRLLATLDAVVAHPHAAADALPEGTDVHAETRRLLAATVRMPDAHGEDRRRAGPLAAASGVRFARRWRW
jgi:ferrous iron transport protein B